MIQLPLNVGALSMIARSDRCDVVHERCCSVHAKSDFLCSNIVYIYIYISHTHTRTCFTISNEELRGFLRQFDEVCSLLHARGGAKELLLQQFITV